ncbi:50S ribosomal protein L4 [Candidatus Poribacteria bacterium]|nr:50S ribosomal protein L4 [Candidatus Poribacteria bacterium]
MISIEIKDTKGQQKGSIELNEDIFGVAGKKSVLYDIVRMQLNNSRQGNACTKNRAEVNKTGKKPWKQKGTGRARAGSAGSPLWRGGGIVFGPRPRDYGYQVNRKLSGQAINLALSEKVRSNELLVIDNLDVKEPKTKVINDILENLKLDNDKLLFVLSDKNELILKSTRNIPNVKTVSISGLNVYDILNANKIVFTKDAVNKIQEA